MCHALCDHCAVIMYASTVVDKHCRGSFSRRNEKSGDAWSNLRGSQPCLSCATPVVKDLPLGECCFPGPGHPHPALGIFSHAAFHPSARFFSSSRTILFSYPSSKVTLPHCRRIVSSTTSFLIQRAGTWLFAPYQQLSPITLYEKHYYLSH